MESGGRTLSVIVSAESADIVRSELRGVGVEYEELDSVGESTERFRLDPTLVGFGIAFATGVATGAGKKVGEQMMARVLRALRRSNASGAQIHSVTMDGETTDFTLSTTEERDQELEALEADSRES